MKGIPQKVTRNLPQLKGEPRGWGLIEAERCSSMICG